MSHALLIGGERADIARFEPWLDEHKRAAENLRDIREQSPEINSATVRAGRFLSLASLVSVLLCAGRGGHDRAPLCAAAPRLGRAAQDARRHVGVRAALQPAATAGGGVRGYRHRRHVRLSRAAVAAAGHPGAHRHHASRSFDHAGVRRARHCGAGAHRLCAACLAAAVARARHPHPAAGHRARRRSRCGSRSDPRWARVGLVIGWVLRDACSRCTLPAGWRCLPPCLPARGCCWCVARACCAVAWAWRGATASRT